MGDFSNKLEFSLSFVNEGGKLRASFVPQRMADVIWSIAEQIRSSAAQEGLSVLDVRQGKIFHLNHTGAAIFTAVQYGKNRGEVVELLSRQFSITPEIAAKDFDRFLKTMKMTGMISEETEQFERKPLAYRPLLPGTPKTDRCVSRRPAFVFGKALLGLLAYDMLGFGKKFTAMHDFVKRYRVKPFHWSRQTVDLVCDAVGRACLWYPKRVLCLQRSAITTCLLRHFGVPAVMTMGAQDAPFKAHAWTEVEGRVVNEQRDVQTAYTVWERC